MLETLNLKNNAETRYRCQVSVYRTIGPLVIISIPTPDFPPFLLCGNLGSLLYGNVSVMSTETNSNDKRCREPQQNKRICIVRINYWVFSALKGTHFYILIVVTAAGVVLCVSPKKQPRTSSIVQLIFFFGPLRSAEIF